MPLGYMNVAANNNFGPLAIVQVPHDSFRFYVFEGILNAGLYYYIVNMKLDSGRGDVEQNYQGIWFDHHTSSLAIVMQPNDTDFWLVNLARADTLYVYPVTSSGIGKPKKQGIINVGNNYYNLRIRPDHKGDKIAFAGIYNKLTANTGLLYSFNNKVGVVSLPKYYCDTFGLTDVEFSPNDSLLYCTVLNNHASIVQFNPNVPDINTSAIKVLNSNKYAAYGLQLASNNKIYFTGIDTFKYLGAINSPDNIGSACNVQPLAINLYPYVSGYSLPNIYAPVRKLKWISSSPSNGCQDSIKFTNLSDSVYFNSFKWFFGDGDSSSLFAPSHKYLKKGKYNVTLVGINICDSKQYYNDSIFVQVPAEAGFKIDTIIYTCQNSNIVLRNSFKDRSQFFIYNYGDGTDLTKDTTHIYIKPGIYTVTQSVSNGICPDTLRRKITILAVPKPNVGGAQKICSGNSITIGEPFTEGHIYSWASVPSGYSSTLSSGTIIPRTSTTYYLTESILGVSCSVTDSAIVTVNDIPNALPIHNLAICNGNKITVGNSLTNGHSYFWHSNPAGFTSTTADPIVAPVASSTYYLTETIASTGCSSIDSELVTVNQLPVPLSGQNQTICNGTALTIGTNPTSGHIYNWTSNPKGFSSAQSNPKASPSVNTIYFLMETIWSTGCSNTDSIKISINPTPDATTGESRSICNGTTIILGNPSSVDHIYSWTSNPDNFISNNSNPKVSPNETTTYYLTETILSTGCTTIDTIQIDVKPVPNVYVTNNQTICQGLNINLGIASDGGKSYSWTSKPAGFFSTSANPLVTPQNTTTYFLTETINPNGCSSTDSVTINVSPMPKPKAGIDQIICKGDKAILGYAGANGDSYQWNRIPPGFTSTLSKVTDSPTVSSTYILTETNNISSCTSNDTTKISVVEVKPVILGNDTICGDVIPIRYRVNFANGATWNWRIANGKIISGEDSTIVLIKPGYGIDTLVVTETNLLGCKGTNSKTIQVKPGANAHFNTIINGTDFSFNSVDPLGKYYNWTFGDGTFGSLKQEQHNYSFIKDSMLKVSLTLTSDYGCMSTFDTLIHIKSPALNILNFPNPFSNETSIQIELDKPSHIQIIVYDAIGRQITTLANKDQSLRQQSYILDATRYNLNSGVYYLKIFVDDKIYVRSVVRQ